MTEATHSTRYRPPHTHPAVDAHPDTPARAPSYHLSRYQGDPYRQLAAAVLLNAVDQVRRSYRLDQPLAAQAAEVQAALVFLTHGLNDGHMARYGRQEVQPDVYHTLSGQETLIEMPEERLAATICAAKGKKPAPTRVRPLEAELQAERNIQRAKELLRELRAARLSFRNIGRRLEALGIPTRRGKTRWPSTTVQNLWREIEGEKA